MGQPAPVEGDPDASSGGGISASTAGQAPSPAEALKGFYPSLVPDTRLQGWSVGVVRAVAWTQWLAFLTNDCPTLSSYEVFPPYKLCETGGLCSGASSTPLLSCFRDTSFPGVAFRGERGNLGAVYLYGCPMRPVSSGPTGRLLGSPRSSCEISPDAKKQSPRYFLTRWTANRLGG